MQFSDTTNEQGLIQDITFWTGANTSSQAYPIEDRTRNINERYREVATSIMEVDAQWTYDDENKSTLPVATTDLVDGQRDYSLPTDAFQIKRVRVKDNNEDWSTLEPIQQSNLDDIDEDLQGLPTHYWEEGNSLLLYPIPDTSSITTTNGLKVNMSRGVDTFNTTSTSSTPGFHENFHRMLSIGASIDYLISNEANQEKVQNLQTEYQKYESSLRDAYGRRNEEDVSVMDVTKIDTI